MWLPIQLILYFSFTTTAQHSLFHCINMLPLISTYFTFRQDRGSPLMNVCIVYNETLNIEEEFNTILDHYNNVHERDTLSALSVLSFFLHE